MTRARMRTIGLCSALALACALPSQLARGDAAASTKNLVSQGATLTAEVVRKGS